jgi:hypothetical protein
VILLAIDLVLIILRQALAMDLSELDPWLISNRGYALRSSLRTMTKSPTSTVKGIEGFFRELIDKRRGARHGSRCNGRSLPGFINNSSDHALIS